MKFYFEELKIHYSSLIKDIEDLINSIKKDNSEDMSALDDFMHGQFIAGILSSSKLSNYKLVATHQGHQNLYVKVYSNGVFICQLTFIAKITFPVVKGKKFKRNRLIEYSLYAIFISKYNKLEYLNIYYEFHSNENCLILEQGTNKSRLEIIFNNDIEGHNNIDVSSMKEEYDFTHFCKSLGHDHISRLSLALFENKHFTEAEKEAMELSYDIYFDDTEIQNYSINIEEIKKQFKPT